MGRGKARRTLELIKAGIGIHGATGVNAALAPPAPSGLVMTKAERAELPRRLDPPAAKGA